MNKQALINGLKCVRYHNPDDEACKRYNEGIDTGIRFAKRLEEFEKPVVPQYVADFYESIKDNFEYNLYRLCIQYKDNSDELSDEIWAWFDDSDNESLQTLNKMKLLDMKSRKLKYFER